MERVNSLQQTRVLQTLGEEPLQQLLDRFTPLISSPPFLINLQGEIIVCPHEADMSGLHDHQFYIDQHEHRITVSNQDDGQFMVLAAPLYVQSELDAYIAIYVKRSKRVKNAERVLQFLANTLSEKAYSEFELNNLTEELIEKYNEVNLIYDITEGLGAVFDPQKVCDVILEKVVEVIGVEKASVMLYHEQSNRLHLVASYGMDLSEEEMKDIAIPPGEGVAGTVFNTGEHILLENIAEQLSQDNTNIVQEHEYEHELLVSGSSRYKKKSYLSIPMICSPQQTEQKVIGVINMTEKLTSDMFTSGDLRLLTAIASQAAMSLYNIQLIEEVKDAERVKREIEIAQQIQMGLLPAVPPDVPGIELAGRCLPAMQVGGDYYDFFLSPDNRLGLVIADVSGHNVGAALMMAAARSTLRSEVLTRCSPSQILENTNLVLYDDLTNAELFITMFYAEYETQTRILRYSNGGHNHPIVLREGACLFLDTDGMLIGMLESVDFEEKTIQLQPDDFVIFYTDGVVEAVNEAGEMFQLERLCDVIEANWQSDASHLLDTIYEQVEQYSGSALRTDDITVVALKVH